MKGYLPELVFGGLIITIILQGVLFSATGLQSSRLQKQSIDISQKLDKLQTIQEEVQTSLIKLRNETALYDANQQGRDQILGITQTDPNNLLSSANLSQTFSLQTTPNPKSLRLKSGWNVVDAFENTRTSSRILGQIQVGKDYVIVSKQQDWYQIKLDSQTNAWVQTQFVYETN